MITEEEILQARILVVDDEETTTRLFTEVLNKAGYVNVTATNNSSNVFDLYKQTKPDLLILDINMPEIDGFEILDQLSSSNNGDYLPILIVSNENSSAVRHKALNAGGRDYLIKPFDNNDALVRIRNLIEVRLLHNEVVDQNIELERRVKLRTHELYETQVDVIQRLARAIEYRDSETGMHIIRMSQYSALLAATIGLDMKMCELILMASPLHDIGKIGIPDRILSKPGKLNDEEWEIMKTHTKIGAELLSGGNSKFLNLASEIALTHHERWDGTGYPNGLKGEEIPLVGRICGITDVLDALLCNRPYKKSWPLNDALEELQREAGSHFDPNLVESLMSIREELERIQNKYNDAVLEDAE